MINTFLKAKHWQLFILTFGMQILVQMVWMVSVLSNISYDYDPDLEELFQGFEVYLFFLLISSFIYYLWMYSAGLGMQKYIPEGLKMNTAFFKFAVLFPLVFLLFYIYLFWWFIESGFDNPFMFIWLMPVFLFIAFCTFYTYWFAAKAVKTAEFQREVKFSEYIAEFFLFWFYPVGVWIIQPNIHSIIKGDNAKEKVE